MKSSHSSCSVARILPGEVELVSERTVSELLFTLSGVMKWIPRYIITYPFEPGNRHTHKRTHKGQHLEGRHTQLDIKVATKASISQGHLGSNVLKMIFFQKKHRLYSDCQGVCQGVALPQRVAVALNCLMWRAKVASYLEPAFLSDFLVMPTYHRTLVYVCAYVRACVRTYICMYVCMESIGQWRHIKTHG